MVIFHLYIIGRSYDWFLRFLRYNSLLKENRPIAITYTNYWTITTFSFLSLVQSSINPVLVPVVMPVMGFLLTGYFSFKYCSCSFFYGWFFGISSPAVYHLLILSFIFRGDLSILGPYVFYPVGISRVLSLLPQESINHSLSIHFPNA